MPGNYQHGTETILVVDDEEYLRTVIVDFLGQLGYRILAAANGQEALAVARDYAGTIDALLSDVVMEGLTGPELAKTLQRDRPALKVIFMSGYADTSVATDGMLDPGIVLVQKPFTVRALSARLREILDQSPAV